MSDETFVQTLAGRDIEFKIVKPGQLVMLKRMAERAQATLAASDGTKGSGALADMLQRSMDVVESLVVKPEDITFLETEILMGRLEQNDLLAVLGGPKKQAPKKKTPKATPKAAPRKATTPVASRGRTKR